MTDIQEAIDWAYAMNIIDADKTMSDYALKILADSYREKCEECEAIKRVANTYGVMLIKSGVDGIELYTNQKGVTLYDHL
jgi:hypothetical protein